MAKEANETKQAKEDKTISVGLVMPIAPIENCSAEHWLDVKSIIADALSASENYTFDTKIVSESNSIGLIHKRIVQGLYNSKIVICDVSCKNPNVMFELGMRLAFDKPTIIIKDDKTDYSFDTGGIEHITYPRDLRFNKIIEFKSTLLQKTIATYEDSIKDANHSPFLKSFGEFMAATIETTEVPATKMLIEMIDELQNDISHIKRNVLQNNSTHNVNSLIRDALSTYSEKSVQTQADTVDDVVKYVSMYIQKNHGKNFPKELIKKIVINSLLSNDSNFANLAGSVIL